MKKLVYTILLMLWVVHVLPISVFWADLLEKAFEEAIDQEYASDIEGDEILWKKSLNISFDWIWLQWPIISRIAQFMLRMTVILAVPMVIYSGIRIMLAAGDSAKFTEALKHVWYVVLWVFLALISVMIVLLIISITNTNLWNI